MSEELSSITETRIDTNLEISHASILVEGIGYEIFIM